MVTILDGAVLDKDMTKLQTKLPTELDLTQRETNSTNEEVTSESIHLHDKADDAERMQLYPQEVCTTVSICSQEAGIKKTDRCILEQDKDSVSTLPSTLVIVSKEDTGEITDGTAVIESISPNTSLSTPSQSSVTMPASCHEASAVRPDCRSPLEVTSAPASLTMCSLVESAVAVPPTEFLDNAANQIEPEIASREADAVVNEDCVDGTFVPLPAGLLLSPTDTSRNLVRSREALLESFLRQQVLEPMECDDSVQKCRAKIQDEIPDLFESKSLDSDVNVSSRSEVSQHPYSKTSSINVSLSEHASLHQIPLTSDAALEETAASNCNLMSSFMPASIDTHWDVTSEGAELIETGMLSYSTNKVFSSLVQQPVSNVNSECTLISISQQPLNSAEHTVQLSTQFVPPSSDHVMPKLHMGTTVNLTATSDEQGCGSGSERPLSVVEPPRQHGSAARTVDRQVNYSSENIDLRIEHLLQESCNLVEDTLQKFETLEEEKVREHF